MVRTLRTCDAPCVAVTCVSWHVLHSGSVCRVLNLLCVQQSGTVRSVVRKKAALCLLRLMRKTPADQQLVSADTFAPIMSQLLEERDLGLLLGAVTLLLGICVRTTTGGSDRQQQPLVNLTCSITGCVSVQRSAAQELQ